MPAPTWVRVWFERWGRFDSATSLASYAWAGFLAVTGFTGAAVVAWTASTLGWFWETWGWLGVAGAGLLAWLVIALGFFLLASATRLRNVAAAPKGQAGSPPEDAPALVALDAKADDLDRRLEELARSTVFLNKAKDDQVEIANINLARVNTRISELESIIRPKVRGLLDLMENGDFSNRFDALDAKIKGMRSDIDKLEVMLADTLADVRSNHTQLHDRVAGLFRAQNVEREMDRLLADIEPVSAKLRLPMSDAIGLTNWSEWASDFELWRNKLEELSQLVSPYMKIDESVFRIDPGRYKPGLWNLSEMSIPDGDQLHDFKTFYMTWQQFQQIKPAFITAVRNAARA